MARPSKFCPAIEEAICECLKIGATRTDAAQSAGIDRDTLRRWMKSIPAFYGAVTRAEAEAALRFTATLAKAANDGDWRASLEWLKRRRREEWGDNPTIRADARVREILLQQFPDYPAVNGTAPPLGLEP